MRAVSASTNCCIPPRSAVKTPRAAGRWLLCACQFPSAAPFLWAAAFALARICRCAASIPRVSEPYTLSISTSRGSTDRALSCAASPPKIPLSSGSASRSTASEPKCRSTNAATVSSGRPLGRGGSSSSRPIRILVFRLNSRVSAVGISFVGTRNIRPSGRATRRFFTTIQVLRCASFEGSSSPPSPSSRHSSAAAGFSLKKESGPRSTTTPSTTSELKLPPKRERDSNSVYSTGAPAWRACSSSKAAASPAIPPPIIAVRIPKSSHIRPGAPRAPSTYCLRGLGSHLARGRGGLLRVAAAIRCRAGLRFHPVARKKFSPGLKPSLVLSASCGG